MGMNIYPQKFNENLLTKLIASFKYQNNFFWRFNQKIKKKFKAIPYYES